MHGHSQKYSLITVAILLLMISGVSPAYTSPHITGVSPSAAEPGVTICIVGADFGSTSNYISFSGLAVTEDVLVWSDAMILVVVPEHAVSGTVRVVPSGSACSNPWPFTILRSAGDREPSAGAAIIGGPGLAGGAWGVAQDGSTAYVLTGMNGPALIVLDLTTAPYTRLNTVYLPAGGSDIRLSDDKVLIAGSQGLWLYRASDLRSGNPGVQPAAVYRGANTYALDVVPAWESAPAFPFDGLIALTEWGNGSFAPRLILLSLLGTDLFERGILTGFDTLNLGAVALDAARQRVYAGGWVNGHVYAIDCQDPDHPFILTTSAQQHTTHRFTVSGDRLWSGRAYINAMNQFAAFDLDDAHLLDLLGVVGGPLPFSASVDPDGDVLCGSSGTGGRAYLIDPATTDFASEPQAEATLIDLAYDVDCHEGRMLIANEWVGLETYQYDRWSLAVQPELRVPTGGFCERIWGKDDYLYAAHRGGGLWRVLQEDPGEWSSVGGYGIEAEGGCFVYAGHPVAGGNLLLTATHTILGTEVGELHLIDDAMDRTASAGIGSLDDDGRGFWFGRIVRLPGTDTYLVASGRHRVGDYRRGIVSCRVCPGSRSQLDQVHHWGSLPDNPKLGVFGLAVYQNKLITALAAGENMGITDGAVQIYTIGFNTGSPEAVPLDCIGSDTFSIPDIPEQILDIGRDVFAVAIRQDDGLAAVAWDQGVGCFRIGDTPAVLTNLTPELVPAASRFTDVAFDGAGYLYAVSANNGIFKILIDSDTPEDSVQVAFYPGIAYSNAGDVFPDPDVEVLTSPQGIWIGDNDRVFVGCRTGNVYELDLPGGALPTPTPTPDCVEFGVTMEISAQFVTPGDTFHVTAHLCNPDLPLADVPFVAMLDIGTGDFWFYPGWVHFPGAFDYLPVDLPSGFTDIAILPEFVWPDTGTGSFYGIRIWGAMLTADMQAILGEFDWVIFGYGPGGAFHDE